MLWTLHYKMIYQSNTTKRYCVYYFNRATCFDSIRIETCCPNTIIERVRFCYVSLIHHFCLYMFGLLLKAIIVTKELCKACWSNFYNIFSLLKI